MRFKTRQRAYRILFVVLCVLPTAVTLSWAAFRHRPGARDAMSREIELHSGLSVEFASLKRPLPGVTRLEKLSLHDPETSRLLARLDWVELTRGKSRSTVMISPVSIDVHSLRMLGQALHDRFLKMHREQDHFLLTAPEIKLTDKGIQLSLVDTQLEIERGGSAVRARIRFRSDRTAPESSVVASRVITDNEPMTRIELNSPDYPLPAAMILSSFGFSNPFGVSAFFCGRVQAQSTTEGWSVHMSGQLLSVDLLNLIGKRFPHRITGQADVYLDSVEFADSKLRSANLFIQSDGGTVSSSLLRSLNEYVGLELKQELSTVGEREIDYDALATSIIIDQTGLRIIGRCSDSGSVMSRRQIPLLTNDPKRRVALASVIRALVPDARQHVPAVEQATALIDILPLPSATVEH